MARIAAKQAEKLRAAIRASDALCQVRDAIEHLHHVVFHGNERADWRRVRDSAEQILIADIVTRYRGSAEALVEAVRTRERAGPTWTAAVQEIAGQMHSYYTTPLGVVMRRDLFGDGVAFILPDAELWIRQQTGETAAASAGP